jgi:ABC-type sugar transport system ATPase subunit
MSGLEISGLGLSRPGFSLDVDLCLPEARLGAILGASGCGKSTTLKLVAGLLVPERGSIRLGDRELVGLPPERRRVGLVFQDLALFPHMSAQGNIEYALKVAGMDRAERTERVGRLAASLRITSLLGRRPSALSGGEQQRVALARSLAASPDLLLLDEPLSSLDAALRRELRTELRDSIREAGLAALHVTHDVEEALFMGDRIYLMDGGRMIQAGSPEAVWASPANAVAARLLGRGPLIRIEAWRVDGGRPVARTALGDFRLPPGGMAPHPHAALPEGWLHFAYDALHPGPEAEATGAGREENPITGRVLRSAYLGRSRRVILSLGEEELELDLPASIDAAEGQVLRLAVAVGDCRVLA